MKLKALVCRKAVLFYAAMGLVWLCTFVLAIIPLSYASGDYVLYGSVIAACATLLVVGVSLPHFSVSVPEVTGLVTVNMFTGEMKAYPSGFSFRLPWEQVKKGNYINLRVMRTNEVRETYPSADGPEMVATWSLQYVPEVETLPAYIAVDEETINKGLNEVAGGRLRRAIQESQAEKARGKDVQHSLEKTLLSHLKTETLIQIPDPDHPEQTLGVTVERAYGIRILLAAISDIDFEATYQQARSTAQVVRRLKDAAEQVVREGDGSISSKDALDSVLMVAGKGVTKTVNQDTKLFDVSPGLANAIVKVVEAVAGRDRPQLKE